MTRVIGILSEERQVNSLVDSLRNSGFERKDMIISHTDKGQMGQVKDDDEIEDIKTELEGFFEKDAYTNTLNMSGYGIVVAVELSKRQADLVKSMMELNGATDIQMD